MDLVENSGRATGSSETNADLFSGLLAERCDLWQALRGHPVHRPRRAQSSQAASRGVEDGDRNAVEPLFQLPERRCPALNSYALELEAEIFHARDRPLGERLQGILEREVLEAAFREGEQHLAVGDGVRFGLPACPVAHPHKVGPVDLRDVNDLVVFFARRSIGPRASSTRLWLPPTASIPRRPSSGPSLNASLPGARSRKPRSTSVAARRETVLLSTPSMAAISPTRCSWLTSLKRRRSCNARSTDWRI